jgi:excisionase family DNA binding protein
MEQSTPITMTVRQAVKTTGISRTRIYAALRAGDLSARKIGKRTLIAYADLESFLARLPKWSGA